MNYRPMYEFASTEETKDFRYYVLYKHRWVNSGPVFCRGLGLESGRLMGMGGRLTGEFNSH